MTTHTSGKQKARMNVEKRCFVAMSGNFHPCPPEVISPPFHLGVLCDWIKEAILLLTQSQKFGYFSILPIQSIILL